MHEITDDEKTWLMTLDKIYKYASDEELEAIVHSIIDRLWDQQNGTFEIMELYEKNIHAEQMAHMYKPTDKELHKLAKGLRKPQ